MKKEKKWGVIALILMTTTAMTGCSNDNDSENQEPEPTPVNPVVVPSNLELTRAEQELVNHSNDFAFRLFDKITERRDPGCFGVTVSGKSIIISPISITYALGMLNNGAAGQTQQQINSVLGFGDTGADGINNFCYKMLKTAPILDSLTKVMIANTIYVRQGYELLPDFVKKAKAFYNAEPETRDFKDGKTLDVINQWASDHTEGMIKKVLDSIDPDAISYLLNAIYFKGSWTKKFDKELTVKEPFNNVETTYTDMMHQTATFEYAENDYCQALRLPYGNGSFQMTILLPKEAEEEPGAKPLIFNPYIPPKVPTTEEWQQLNERMDSAVVDVKLPRFETDTDISLNDIMAKLGMPDAFKENKADFRYFCNTPTYIGMMKQVAKIKLDEEGTEAAAVTVIGTYATAIDPTPQLDIITFHANHPFLYVISEKKTGAIFFIGQYTGS